MEHQQIGFPDFQKEIRRQFGPLLDSAITFREMGRDILSNPCSGQLAPVVREIAHAVANSLESVLILVSNGCAEDAFRIARTMFESAVAIHYLESRPDLVQDYVDFLWVKRKRHHDDLVKYIPSQAERVDRQQLEQMNAEYERVKPRFTNRKGKARSSWCRVSLRAMAEEIKADSMYVGMYGFTSSITHTDMLGLVSASGETDAVLSVPSLVNLPLALQMGVVSCAMTLSAVNQVSGLKFDEQLSAGFEQFKQASGDLTIS
jgi:hypothetical protein